jgi:hypothetical protein
VRPSHHIFLAAVLLAACGPTISSSHLNDSPRAMQRRLPSTVELFTTRVPDRPYVEVAMIETRQGHMTGETSEDVFDMLRGQAAEMGCDGVVLLGANDAVESDPTSSGPRTRVRTLHGYRGTCIMWRDADPAAKAASPPDPRCNPPCGPGFKCWGGVCASEK